MVRNNRQSDRDVTLYKDACNWKNNQLVPLVVVGGGGGGGGGGSYCGEEVQNF